MLNIGAVVVALCDPMLFRPTTFDWGLFDVDYKAFFFITWVELSAYSVCTPLTKGVLRAVSE